MTDEELRAFVAEQTKNMGKEIEKKVTMMLDGSLQKLKNSVDRVAGGFDRMESMLSELLQGSNDLSQARSKVELTELVESVELQAVQVTHAPKSALTSTVMSDLCEHFMEKLPGVGMDDNGTGEGLFGSSTNAASSGLPFAFSSPATTTPLQPVFSNPSSFRIGSSPSGNNDQMSMEDSMAEDTIQATPPAAALFGQQPMPDPSSSFTYGSGTPAMNPFGASPFQFGGQPSMAAQPNPSPFQAFGSLEFAGGSFSLGASGGGDKSTRRMMKVKRTQRKR